MHSGPTTQPQIIFMAPRGKRRQERAFAHAPALLPRCRINSHANRSITTVRSLWERALRMPKCSAMRVSRSDLYLQTKFNSLAGKTLIVFRDSGLC